jgi:hypothetical protein
MNIGDKVMRDPKVPLNQQETRSGVTSMSVGTVTKPYSGIPGGVVVEWPNGIYGFYDPKSLIVVSPPAQQVPQFSPQQALPGKFSNILSSQAPQQAPPGKFSNILSSQAPPTQRSLTVPALTWTVGAWVERNWQPIRGYASDDKIGPGTKGEIMYLTSTGGTLTTAKIRWTDGTASAYRNPEQYLKLIQAPASVGPTGCARCGRPWDYEPVPSGLCGECRVIASML